MFLPLILTHPAGVCQYLVLTLPTGEPIISVCLN